MKKVTEAGWVQGGDPQLLPDAVFTALCEVGGLAETEIERAGSAPADRAYVAGIRYVLELLEEEGLMPPVDDE